MIGIIALVALGVLALGGLWYVVMGIRMTFWLPSVDGPILYSEKFAKTLVPRWRFAVKAHLVLTAEHLVVAVPPLMYVTSRSKGWQLFPFAIKRSAIAKISDATGIYNCALTLNSAQSEPVIWRFHVTDLARFRRLIDPASTL